MNTNNIAPVDTVNMAAAKHGYALIILDSNNPIDLSSKIEINK